MSACGSMMSVVGPKLTLGADADGTREKMHNNEEMERELTKVIEDFDLPWDP